MEQLYLGLGRRIITPPIGTMLAGGRAYLGSFPHILFFPAVFIALLQVSFNLFGNGLRDALNPVAGT